MIVAASLLSSCGTIPNHSPNLAGSGWRVTAINGRSTPEGPVAYSMTFEERKLGARFGCNIIGGNYRIRGATLTTDALVMTEMACSEPASSFEAQGSAILQQPMAIDALPAGGIRLLNRVGSIDLARQH